MTSAEKALRLYMRLCSSSMRLGCTNAVSKTCAEAFKESMTRADEMLNAYTCYALASALHIDTQSTRTMASQGLVDTSIRRTSAGGGCQDPWQANVFEGMPALLGASPYNTWT
jgi:hypothetical protein